MLKRRNINGLLIDASVCSITYLLFMTDNTFKLLYKYYNISTELHADGLHQNTVTI